jgi:hypothetical protein
LLFHQLFGQRVVSLPSITLFSILVTMLLSKVVKGVSGGIGLVNEKYHDHKQRKSAAVEGERSPNRSSHASVEGLVNPLEPGLESSNDEQVWTLDEAAGDPPTYEESETQQLQVPERTVTELVQNVFASPVPHQDHPKHLPHPIVIPQRRPGAKGRGFARAYPPDMEAFGFDEPAFMRFLQSFQDASEAASWLKALSISSQLVGLVPGTITLAVSLSLQIASGHVSSALWCLPR